MIGIKESENVVKNLENFPDEKDLEEPNNNIDEFKAEDEHDKKPEHNFQNLQAPEGDKTVNNLEVDVAALIANMVPMDGEKNLIPNGLIENYEPNKIVNVENEIKRDNDDNAKDQEVIPVQEVSAAQYVVPPIQEEAAQAEEIVHNIAAIPVVQYAPVQEGAAADHIVQFQAEEAVHNAAPDAAQYVAVQEGKAAQHAVPAGEMELVQNAAEVINQEVPAAQYSPLQEGVETHYVVPSQDNPTAQHVPAQAGEAAHNFAQVQAGDMFHNVAQAPIQERVEAEEGAVVQDAVQVQEVEVAQHVLPIQEDAPAQNAVPLASDNGFVDTHAVMMENPEKNVEVPVIIQEPEVQTTKRIAVRFDDEGNSIDEDKHHEQNCQAKEDSNEEKVSTKKRKAKSQNLDENDFETKTTPKVAVRFDSKGDSIDDDDTHHGENCEVKTSEEAKLSTKKTKRQKGSHEHDEDQIDSENEASNYREDESSHESDEDDGIPVITIPLGDILRKYARMMEGNNSEYEEEETDERFVIRGYNDRKKDKTFVEL